MNSSNEEDRISELPESVLHLILSSLDLKLAIQTSILSTKWRYVWRSLPFLKFDQFHFPKTKKGNLGFVDFVDNVLNLRDSSSSIQRFHLNCYKDRGIDQSDYDKRLSRWITTAVERNVQDMCLRIPVGDQFKLPQCLFSCKSLTKLELFLYDYKLNLPDSMNLPVLKTLILCAVEFEGNVDIPNKIISSCPVLESLEFEFCEFQQPTLDINAPQLKHLVLRHCDSYYYHNKIILNKYIVKLNAPNLISFHCYDDMYKDYCLENLSGLMKAETIMNAEGFDENGNSNLDDEIREVYVRRMFKILRALHNVETLTLSAWFIEDIIGKQKIHPFFDKARLDLAKAEGDWEAGALLHLKFVNIRGVRGCLNELQFLEFLLKNGMVLEKVIIKPLCRKELSREFVQQLLTLPRASSSIEFSVP